MTDWEHKRLVTGQPTQAEDISEGDVYGDERHAEHPDAGESSYPRRYEIVFADENRVTLRNLTQDGDYRHERIPSFLEGVGTRWTRLSEGTGTAVDSVPDFAAAIRLLKLERERLAAQDNRRGTHVAEGVDMAIDLLRDMKPSPVEWTTVDGIGTQIATEIEDAGIQTDIDAVLASDDDLLDIPGVGNTTVDNIREQVNVRF